ncbi:acetyltransferase (GNAT) family protein [Balneicella halophila]|uniref:Acetyltransferase (GNAT) family protein n=1 Tax=Balneicella halophila TaxID=1537566 RepID=A0A7L4UP27_BALHA|nr:GNAT family N-acetyltransferase [Balneicella halophila]PVX50027.1 acetyltransferase (GNAT) family protein [Balneicella halophila]
MIDASFWGIPVVEWIGYIASVFVLISLMMSSILRLRIINLIGALIFSIYGLLIESYPVAIMNFLIVLSNIYYLYKMRKIKEEFTILEASPNSTFMGRFIELNYKEIKRFFPKFIFNNEVHNISFYILRNMNVAGLFIATHYNTNTLKVVLDYVSPEYRDFKIGDYIHHQLVKYFLAKGYRKLLCDTSNAKHINYLLKMGYKKEVINNHTVYIKTLG